MFQSLTSKFSKIFKAISSKGSITESDIKEFLQEIKTALLEADVAIEVVNHFTKEVELELIGKKIFKSVNIADLFIKTVYEKMVNLLTVSQSGLDNLNNTVKSIVLVGVQGNGKTTTCAKLGKYYAKQGKKVLMVSFDIYRFAAQEQLNILAKQNNIDYLNYDQDENDIYQIYNSVQKIKDNYDIILYDTAGRNDTDDIKMSELSHIKSFVEPDLVLLIIDSMIGQNVVSITNKFHESIGISGVVLTKMDSDARGGAAFNISYVAKKPIVFVGTGEKIDQLEKFDLKKVVSRILDMGDIDSLAKKAYESISKEEMENDKARFFSGKFDLIDYMKYINTTKKMGGLQSILGFLPGTGQLLSQSKSKIDYIDKNLLQRQIAIILSMTNKERKNPDLLNASRKKRIATGSGVDVSDVNLLLKQFNSTKEIMKKIKNNPTGMMKEIMSMIRR